MQGYCLHEPTSNYGRYIPNFGSKFRNEKNSSKLLKFLDTPQTPPKLPDTPSRCVEGAQSHIHVFTSQPIAHRSSNSIPALQLAVLRKPEVTPTLSAWHQFIHGASVEQLNTSQPPFSALTNVVSGSERNTCLFILGHSLCNMHQTWAAAAGLA